MWYHLANEAEGASLLALVSLPTFIKDYIDTYARSNFSSRFLSEALMSMAQHGTPPPTNARGGIGLAPSLTAHAQPHTRHATRATAHAHTEVTLMEVIREECLPTVWRYLLYHVRCKTEFPKRPDVLKVYHPRVTKLRARGTHGESCACACASVVCCVVCRIVESLSLVCSVKSLVCCSVRGKDGHGFKPLLALTFMFMDKAEKRQFFIDADGLSLFFKVSLLSFCLIISLFIF
jgi:hypothetical protein